MDYRLIEKLHTYRPCIMRWILYRNIKYKVNPVYITDHGTLSVAVSMHFIYLLNIETPTTNVPFFKNFFSCFASAEQTVKFHYKIISSMQSIFWNSETLQNTWPWFPASLHSSPSKSSFKNLARKNKLEVFLWICRDRQRWGYYQSPYTEISGVVWRGEGKSEFVYCWTCLVSEKLEKVHHTCFFLTPPKFCLSAIKH